METMQQTLQTGVDIIAFLNTLSDDNQTGEVLLWNGKQNAKVYIHGGLIMWAFATGQKESFQSILLRENKVSKEDLIEGIRESRRQGKKNLDDILATLGIADTEMRKSIIERHTKAAFSEISQWEDCTVQANVQKGASTSPNGSGFAFKSLLPQTMVQQVSTAPVAPAPVAPAQPQDTGVGPEIHDVPDILERLRLEVRGFLATMIIDEETAMPISTVTDIPEFDIEVVSAFYCDLLKSGAEAIRALGKTSTETSMPEEILITSNDDFVLLRVLGNGAHILYLLIEKDANPGMARIVMKRYIDQIESLLC